MPRTKKQMRMAAPGFVESLQALALKGAIETLIEQHNEYAAMAARHGYNAQQPYLGLQHVSADVDQRAEVEL